MDAARDGLSALALDTGGLAFFDRNKLEAPLQRVLDDSAVYYRLGFEPRESPRDGRFLEAIGFYDPLTQPPTIRIDLEKAQAWLSKGALPSNTVRQLLARAGVRAS